MRYIVILLLMFIWLILAGYTIAYSGFNLRNLLVILMSGVIIFVPLWKKYIKSDNGKK